MLRSCHSWRRGPNFPPILAFLGNFVPFCSGDKASLGARSCSQALPLTSPSGSEVPGGGTNLGLGLWNGPRLSVRGPAPSPSGDYAHTFFRGGGRQLHVPKAPWKETGLCLAIGAVMRLGPQSLAALLSSSPTPDDLNQCDVLQPLRQPALTLWGHGTFASSAGEPLRSFSLYSSPLGGEAIRVAERGLGARGLGPRSIQPLSKWDPGQFTCLTEPQRPLQQVAIVLTSRAARRSSE